MIVVTILNGILGASAIFFLGGWTAAAAVETSGFGFRFVTVITAVEGSPAGDRD